MRYTQKEIHEISKAVMDAYYKKLPFEVAKRQITNNECASYRNFNDWVRDIGKRLKGERVHLALSLNFAKVWNGPYLVDTKLDANTSCFLMSA